MTSFPPPGSPEQQPDDSSREAAPGSQHPAPGADASGAGGASGSWAGSAADARAVAQPGTVPLRPLGLGDMFDGAFRTIRRNPKATLGIAFLVNLVLLVIPVAGLAVLSLLGQLGPLVPEGSLFDPAQSSDPTDQFSVGAVVSGTLSGMSGALASIIVTGLVVQVVARAAIGERIGAGEAWRRTKPRIWALIGLSLLSLLLVGLAAAVVAGLAFAVGAAVGTGAGIAVAVVVGILGSLAAVYIGVRFFLLAPCVLVLEGAGILDAIRRARRLSTGSFWRIFGIYLLISVLANIVASIVSLPVGLLAFGSIFLLGDQTLGTVVYLMLNNLSTVVSGALATPFVGAVVALQYLDLRIRREGLDVRLRQQAASRAGDGTGT